jgi:hypothetical protein
MVIKMNNLCIEVRGAMTCFDPIAPEQVAAYSNGEVGCAALSELLRDCGMSIENVVCDPSRAASRTALIAFDASVERLNASSLRLFRKNLRIFSGLLPAMGAGSEWAS